jgi:hypothetical protein
MLIKSLKTLHNSRFSPLSYYVTQSKPKARVLEDLLSRDEAKMIRIFRTVFNIDKKVVRTHMEYDSELQDQTVFTWGVFCGPEHFVQISHRVGKEIRKGMAKNAVLK